MRRKIQRLARGGGGQAHAFACAAQVDGGEANEHGDRRDHFEVDQRLDPEAPDFLEVRMARNPHHENGEKQRRDDHADQPQKNRAEHLEFGRHRRRVVPQFRPG